MVQGDTWFECNDGTRLFLRRWPSSAAAQRPKAVLHIAHGMAEHSGRYRRFAEELGNAGVEVWAADQRGHGKTATSGENDPAKGGLLGHCHDTDTFDRVTSDICEINLEIRKTWPGVPLILMGHSWGSFIAQNYLANCGSGEGAIDGCILSGTRGPGGFKVRAGIPFMTAIAALRGKQKGSPLARAVADGPYAKAFLPNRTPFDWLSRDEAEVDAYCADPLCGILCSAGFYRDLAKGLYRIHQPEAMARIPKDLPILVFCGGADPVGDMGSSPTILVNAYRSLGIRNIEFALYPGARHEPLNETNRDEVMTRLHSWINRLAALRDTNPNEED